MKDTKRSFLTSCISLLLCFIMLLGTTFAWFTDVSVSANNVIQAGNLDIELQWSKDGNIWHNAGGIGDQPIFNYDKWEPGYTEVRYVKIKNEGSLAFKYQMLINPNGPVGTLAEVIDVSYDIVTDNADFVAPTAANKQGSLDKVGKLNNLINANGTVAGGVLLPDGVTKEGYYTNEIVLCLSLHMDEYAGNEYQNLSIGGTFGIKLIATQFDYENDSFGNSYDNGATWPDTFVGNSASSTVTLNPDNTLASEVTMTSPDGKISATLPAGTLMEQGTTSAILNVYEVENSGANITLNEDEASRSIDVHVNGVAEGNTTVMAITVKELLPTGLNMGNHRFYHVENGNTVEMTLLPVGQTPVHNNYEYDPATGDVVLHLASFSEVAVVAEPPKWKGNFDYSWYTNAVAPVDGEAVTEYVIANADQLAAFGAIVGGMKKVTERVDGKYIYSEEVIQDSFKDKTVKLISDINLGDKESENNTDIIFYPIGYYNSEGTYERTNTAITSGLRIFEGIFDGNGHTVSNFYHNTWEMKGDHDWYSPEEQYYRDGMGLFGRVYKGTVKNLTVSNFSSDGEIATTGVIAAYADGATFENIAIFNCNPRVYNIGNGGIVGCVGWYAKEADLKTTFKNITVDNSNKISALWGSYDVACGGIVGQYYPTSGQTSANKPTNAGIYFENCHVSAVMDVYNDVCANYQYYAYRYTGMLIGSVRENVTIDGHVYPKMDGITASDCTVHFGDWNDYYYCEIIDNTTASYTHDYQMSRLTEIKAIDGTNITYLDGTEGTVPASGRANYVIVDYTKGHGTENATCYHFKDGAVWTHDMGGIQTGIDENGDGQDDLKEDKQHIYLEFNNLVTGYGWGVTSKGVGDLAGVTILDREVGDSVNKFAPAIGNETAFFTESTVTIGELFNAVIDAEVAINPESIQVAVSPFGTDSTAGGTYVANATDWKQGTLTFSGVGKAVITITDYYFCNIASVTVNIIATDKFDTNFVNHEKYLYRVGNQNTVSLGTIFKALNGVTIDDSTVKVSFATIAGNATGIYTANNSTWTSGTIQFTGTGVVKVTIKDATSSEFVLNLEVIDAVNATSATNATSNNVVLLKDISGGFTISNGYAFYGNGFKVTCAGVGSRLNFAGMYGGFIEVNNGGVLDNVRVFSDIYPVALLYSSEAKDHLNESLSTSEKKYYNYQLSAVAITGNGSMITNSYIYGGRNNIYVGDGNVTIANTTTENGVLANIQIKSSNASTVTLKDITTIQNEVKSTYDNAKTMLGCGIIIGDVASVSNPKIIVKGEWNNYNWVTSANATNTSNTYSKEIINKALSEDAYKHTNSNGETTVNLSMIILNTLSISIDDQRSVKDSYLLSNVTMTLKDPDTGFSADVNGQVYSVLAGKGTPDAVEPEYIPTKNLEYKPYANKDETVGNNKDTNDGGDDSKYCYWEGDLLKLMYKENETPFTIDVATLVSFNKFGFGLDSTVIVTKDGNFVNIVDGKATFTDAGNYVITYTVTDPYNYDKDGKQVANATEWTFSFEVEVSVVKSAGKNAEINVTTTSFYGNYGKTSSWLDPDYHYCLPFMKDVTITDYAEDGVTASAFEATKNIISINVSGDKTSATVTINYLDGRELVITTSGHSVGLGSSGNTVTVKSYDGQLWLCTDGVSNNATTGTWKVNSYKFTGNNGVPVEYTTTRTCNFDSASTNNSPQKSWSDYGTPTVDAIKYIVTFDANGGSCTKNFAYTTSSSAAVTLPTPSRSGYIFAGWYTAASGGTRVGGAGESYTPSANITLYAQWGTPCTVTYDANGGSCGTASEKYTGTALTLPTPTRDGYWFSGWYDAAEGGNKIGDAGATYNPSDEITLYAHWQEKVENTVTYNANGGSCGTPSATYQGTALTLPTPTRTGYTFNGWYTAASGGTKIGDAGASYTPSANVTLYAQWVALTQYTVTYNANGGSVSPTSNTVYEGSSITLPTPSRSGYTFNGWYTAASGGTKIGDADASYKPTANITLYAQWTEESSDPCVTPDTLITLADGTQVRVDSLTGNEELLVWNLETGKLDKAPIMFVDSDPEAEYEIVHLYFSDGTDVKVIYEHGFWDYDLNKYVYLDRNASEYIGHTFAKHNGDSLDRVQLTDVVVETELTTAWSPVTVGHLCYFVNGMLSMPGGVGGLFNIFEVDPETMTYDFDKLQKDIETYGLYTYEELNAICPLSEEMFNAAGGAYLKISIGKGNLTIDELINMINRYSKFI